MARHFSAAGLKFEKRTRNGCCMEVAHLRAQERFHQDFEFNQKTSCLGHLRSFLEELHIQAAPAVASLGEAHPAKWGVATTFLRSKGIISQKDEVFITSLYTLVSDEAIHPLIAPREYCRLFRNIVIEYGVPHSRWPYPIEL